MHLDRARLEVRTRNPAAYPRHGMEEVTPAERPWTEGAPRGA